MERAGAILRLAPVTSDPGLVTQPIAAVVNVLGAAGDVRRAPSHLLGSAQQARWGPGAGAKGASASSAPLVNPE
jgi:hypothetical protein